MIVVVALLGMCLKLVLLCEEGLQPNAHDEQPCPWYSFFVLSLLLFIKFGGCYGCVLVHLA